MKQHTPTPQVDLRSRRILLSTVPPEILVGIEGTAKGELERSVARLLFLADTTEGGDARVLQAPVEHAIARAALDAWTRGHASGEGVGAAYAAVALRVVSASHQLPPGDAAAGRPRQRS